MLQTVLSPLNLAIVRELLIVALAFFAGAVATSYLDPATPRIIAACAFRRESKLRKKLLRLIFEQMPTGVVVATAPEGRIVDGNLAAERIFGHPVIPSKDKESYDAWVAFHEDGRRVESADYPLARVLSGESRPALECRYARRDGSFVWVRLQGEALHDAKGALAGAFVLITDIDAEKTVGARDVAMNLEVAPSRQQRAGHGSKSRRNDGEDER